MGTTCTFQGWPVVDLVYERARGYSPGGARIVLPVEAFPDGFQFVTPSPGELVRPAADAGGPPAPSRVDGAPLGPAPLARRLSYEGLLVMAETLGDQAWEHPPVRLFVVSVSTRRLAGGRGLVDVVAVDERFHWEGGRLDRWSFNRTRADGTVALDSVNEGGSPVSRRDVAELVLSRMFRAPRLHRAPASWDAERPSMQFLPNGAPVLALAQLVTEADLEEPCLLLNGAVGLYAAGEGELGTASAPGAENDRALPPELMLDKGGAGRSLTAEWTYPEDYVFVAGGQTVASVALDDAVPVLDVDGITYDVTEENVRFLTDGAFGLEWLQRFVLLPADLASAAELPEEVGTALRTQAYRLWQVRGVEREKPAAAGGEGRRLVREPGPNAHLLPILARAETVAGRRLAPAVETYTFAMRHRAFDGGAGGLDAEALREQQAAMRELARLRGEIVAAANRRGEPDPFIGKPHHVQLPGGEDGTSAGGYQNVAASTIGLNATGRKALYEAGVASAELDAAVSQARVVKRIAESAGSGFAQQYEEALRRRLRAEDRAAGGTRSDTIYGLGRDFVGLVEQADKDRNFEETTSQGFKRLGYQGLYSSKVEAASRALRLEAETARSRAQAAARERAKAQAYFVNLGRSVDAGARVYDADRGIVETSGLAGHLRNVEVAHDLSHPDVSLIPCPVRIVFGAALRPRLDVPYQESPRPETGAAEPEAVEGGDCPGGDNVVPGTLRDDETRFLAAFERSALGSARPIDAAAVPVGQGLVVQRPDMVELVELNGTTNRPRLEVRAERIAADLFRKKPLVRAMSVTLARPLPVQCNGVVERVTIALRKKDGAPCGFETTVRTGAGALDPRPDQTRVDPARRAAAARALLEAASRERVTP